MAGPRGWRRLGPRGADRRSGTPSPSGRDTKCRGLWRTGDGAGGAAGASRRQDPRGTRATTPDAVTSTASNDKATRVQQMFARIAPRYDLMNTLMTGGRDRAWRRAAARLAAPPRGSLALDLATGTGDLALALLDEADVRGVVGVDFVEGMLRLGRAKLDGRGERRVRLLAGDALALPFADASFGCVASAFLLRNLADLPAGLAEMRRVTAPGGSVVALEITQPTLPGWRQAFRLYFHHVVPAVGALVAGNREAYTYLPQSVDRFVTPAELVELMEAVGLRDVRVRRVGLGTVTIHVGRVGRAGRARAAV
jgi:demethylmenaquinone methyltransferase / 2-methoxy-6-polyprenyl-1,4-benzoquinol methylase